jgi:hypothetical protein
MKAECLFDSYEETNLYWTILLTPEQISMVLNLILTLTLSSVSETLDFSFGDFGIFYFCIILEDLSIITSQHFFSPKGQFLPTI